MRIVFIPVLLFGLGNCSQSKQQCLTDTPERNGTLSAAYEVFNNLTRVYPNSFAAAFLKMSPEQLLCALKGVSIWAHLLAHSVKNSTENDNYEVIDKMNTYVGVFEETMKSEWQRLRKLIESPFEQEVYLQMLTVMRPLILHRENPSGRFEWNIWSGVLTNLLARSPAILKYVTETSKHDRRLFNEMRGFLARCFFYFHTVKYFWKGSVFDNDINKEGTLDLFDEKLEDLHISFQLSYHNMSAIFNEAFNDFNKAYFPGFIVEDIIRPAIETYGGDSCDIAQYIIDKLKSEKSTWREYVVIVSNKVSSHDQYAYFGFQQRVIAETYKGKTVFVFMASKNFTHNKSVYLKENGGSTIRSKEKQFDWNNLSPLLEYAENRRERVQIAVFRGYHDPCIRPNNTIAYDFLELRPFLNGRADHPFKVNVAVIF